MSTELDSLRSTIRREIEGLKSNAGLPADRGPAAHADTATRSRKPCPSPEPIQPSFDWHRVSFHVHELLGFHAEEFIRNAYLAILRREPEPDGMAFYVNQLSRGDAKILILGRLRFSAEGRRQRIQVRGLLSRLIVSSLGRLPLLGYVIRLGGTLVRLPSVFLSQLQHQRYLLFVVAKHQRYLEMIAGRINEDESRDSAWMHAAEQSSRRLTLQLASVQLAAARVETLLQRQDALERQVLGFAAVSARVAELETRQHGNAAAAAEARRDLDGTMARIAAEPWRQGLQGLEGEVRDARREMAVLRNLIDGRAAASDLKAVAGRLQEQVDAVRSDAQEVQARLDAFDGTLRQSLEALVSVRKEVDASAARAAAAEQSAGNARSEFAAQAASLREAMADASARLRACDAALHEARTEIRARMEQSEAALREAVAGSERAGAEAIRTLAATVSASGGQLQALTADTARLRQDLDTLRPDLPESEGGLYLDIERRFRGPEQLVRERQQKHLRSILESPAVRAGRPVLDIGCGRGEWLATLKDGAVSAYGIDTNTEMVDVCRKAGLDAHAANALDELASVPPGSLGAVTAFHVIEHLPMRVLLEVLTRAHRALAPGGIILLESPNPENLVVGAHTFYYDPTHLRPLPPGLMEVILENRGFTSVQTERLSPDDELNGYLGEAVSPRLREMLAGARDYAVIAYRAVAPEVQA